MVMAVQVRVSEKTIDRWNQHPEFRARAEENVAAFRVRFFSERLARKEVRIAARMDIFSRHMQNDGQRCQFLVTVRTATAALPASGADYRPWT